MTDQHIYTGKELTTLLEQVRRELGSEATIIEANKVRSGGVAGFFATESYEVVATTAVDHGADTSVGTDPEEEIDLDRSGPLETYDETMENRRGSQRSLSTALLDRADAISVQERIELSRPPLPRKSPDQDLRENHDEADQLLPLGVPFIDVLTAEIDRSEQVVSEPLAATQRTTTSSPTDPIVTDPVASDPFTDPVASDPVASDPPPSTAAPTLSPEPTFAPDPANDHDQAVSPSAFWARVEAIEEDFLACRADGLITSIVGELGACLNLADKLMVDDSGNLRELLVISQVESLPSGNGHIVRNNNDLDGLLRHWLARGKECLVIVDRRVGARASSHLRHARQVGPGVERLVVTMREEPTDLLQRMQRLGDNVVVDLAFSAEPSHVIDLVEAGIPVATVAGHRLDTSLLAALACCVSSEL